MTVVPAVLTEPPSGKAGGGGVPFVGLGDYLGSLDAAGYVEEEWFAAGEADGRPYTTTVVVRRPHDPAAFSGTLIVEPLHAMGATPVWMYTSQYVLRAGHAWAMVGSQKTALEQHVKSFDADRYASRNIEAEPAPEGTPRSTAPTRRWATPRRWRRSSPRCSGATRRRARSSPRSARRCAAAAARSRTSTSATPSSSGTRRPAASSPTTCSTRTTRSATPTARPCSTATSRPARPATRGSRATRRWCRC